MEETGTRVKREMQGILRESKLLEQKTEAERSASDHAADRPPKEGAERGWERRQRSRKSQGSGTGHRKESWVTLRCRQNQESREQLGSRGVDENPGAGCAG